VFHQEENGHGDGHYDRNPPETKAGDLHLFLEKLATNGVDNQGDPEDAPYERKEARKSIGTVSRMGLADELLRENEDRHAQEENQKADQYICSPHEMSPHISRVARYPAVHHDFNALYFEAFDAASESR
jgi:hypothetical protein